MGIHLWDIYATLGVDMTGYNRDMDAAIDKAQKLNSELNGAKDSAAGSASSGRASVAGSVALGNLMADVVQKGAKLAWDFTREGIDLASAKHEVQNVVDVTFGSYATALDEWARSARSKYGLGEVSAKQYAGLFGDMLSSAGFSGDELYSMATGLTGLVGDIASFRNEGFDEVFTRLYSGMVGETEAIRRYGVNMTVANMEDYSGLNWKDASAMEQYAARYDYIMSHTRGAQGDFARTLDTSLANQQRLLEEGWKEKQTGWGDLFTGAITNLFSNVNKLIGNHGPTLEDTFSAYDSAAQKAAESIDETWNKANVLLNMLDDMAQQGQNVPDNALWMASLRELGQLMPGLSEKIDLTSGAMNTGTEEIRAQAQAWREDAKEAALAAAEMSKIKAMENAQGSLADAQIGLAFAEVKRGTEEKRALEAAGRMAEALTDNPTGRLLFGDTPFDGTIGSAERMLAKYKSSKGLLQFSGADLTQEEQAVYEELNDSVTAYNLASQEAQGYQETIDSLSEQLKTGKAELDAYVQSLNQSESAYSAGLATGSAYSSGMADGLSALPDVSLLSMQVDGSHASGLHYVPYDGYIAKVHRGEAILTAAEAASWRSGESGGRDERIDYGRLAQTIADAMGGMSVQMDGQAVGMLVTPTVSREIGRQVHSRRYTR